MAHSITSITADAERFLSAVHPQLGVDEVTEKTPTLLKAVLGVPHNPMADFYSDASQDLTSTPSSSESAGRLSDWRAIINFLEASPVDFGLVLTMARLGEPSDLLDFDTENEHHAAKVGRAEDYLKSARFQACGACYAPVASYPDGKRLNWPELEPHLCGGLAELARVRGAGETEGTAPPPRRTGAPPPQGQRRPARTVEL